MKGLVAFDSEILTTPADTAVGLTAALLVGAELAVITTELYPINWSLDGTATLVAGTNVGHAQIVAAAPLYIYGNANIAALSLVNAVATEDAQIKVTVFRNPTAGVTVTDNSS
jgi:hypothetical protein